jgi:putative NADPH-quinone reductase
MSKAAIKSILVINGNPARKRATLSEALADAYAANAIQEGHSVRKIKLSALVFDPILHEGYMDDQPIEPDLRVLREAMVQAQHWVLVFPLWHSLPPALFKGFIERTITRGFAFEFKNSRPVALPILKGKTVHIIITCGMPSFVYRWFSGAYTTKALATLFKLCGMKVTHVSVFGTVADHTPEALERYTHYIDACGASGRAGI